MSLIAILLISLILSVIAYNLFRPPFEGRIFYYPNNAGTEIGAERRGIPMKKDIEGRLTVFLEELLLGPMNLELAKALPKETKIDNVAVVGVIAYVDLSRQVFEIEKELPISYDEAFDNMRHNIEFNFPRIEKVVFTIEGQQVNKPLYIMKTDADH